MSSNVNSSTGARKSPAYKGAMLRPRFSHSRRWRVAIALGITLIAGAGAAKEQSPAPSHASPTSR
jgi:hypothetical protein